jgi:hypothetical protein
MQLFQGLLENRCRLTEFPINGTWPADLAYTKLCGYTSCPEQYLDYLNYLDRTFCGNPINYHLPVNYTELRIPDYQFGYSSFDNIFTSTLSIFIVLTLEGWSTFVLIVI